MFHHNLNPAQTPGTGLVFDIITEIESSFVFKVTILSLGVTKWSIVMQRLRFFLTKGDKHQGIASLPPPLPKKKRKTQTKKKHKLKGFK